MNRHTDGWTTGNQKSSGELKMFYIIHSKELLWGTHFFNFPCFIFNITFNSVV